MRILIADDERIVRNGTRMLIEKANPDWEITETVGDGAQALASMKRNVPDVLITDIRMPDMDGIALSKAARSLAPELIIIVISGFSDFEYAKEAIRFGALDYLLKPTNPTDLIRVLEKANRVLEKQRTLKLEEELALTPSEDSSALSATETMPRRVIEAALQYLHKNYKKDITLKHVAQVFSMNPDYFSDLFKKQTGVNFSDYLTNLRIREAKKLLRIDLNLKMYEVAESVGYGNSQYFSKVFKSVTGLTPTEYREQGGSEPRP